MPALSRSANHKVGFVFEGAPKKSRFPLCYKYRGTIRLSKCRDGNFSIEELFHGETAPRADKNRPRKKGLQEFIRRAFPSAQLIQGHVRSSLFYCPSTFVLLIDIILRER